MVNGHTSATSVRFKESLVIVHLVLEMVEYKGHGVIPEGAA